MCQLIGSWASAWWVRLEGALVTQQCPQDVDAAAGQRNYGLDVSPVLLRVSSGKSPGWGRRGEGWTWRTCRTPAGVGGCNVGVCGGFRCGRRNRGARAPARRRPAPRRWRRWRSRRDDELSAQQRAEPGHRLDDRSLWVVAEDRGDGALQFGDSVVHRQDLGSQLCDEPSPSTWPGTDVCCARAASIATWATVCGLRTPRLCSQAVSRACPSLRIASGV